MPLRSSLLATLAAGLVVLACTATPVVDDVPGGPYPLSAARADQVLVDALRAGWPDRVVEPLGEGALGYGFDVWSGVDRDRVTARALPAGEEAWSFTVESGGTAPEASDSVRRELVQRIAEAARSASGR